MAGVLGKSEIIRLCTSDKPLIQDWRQERVQGAAYDLRVGYIITPDQYLVLDPRHLDAPHRQPRFRLMLSPGDTATLATYERLNMPPDVNGQIVPRDGYAKQGLLTLNAGHIDPQFKGFVTAQVINVTERPIPIDLGESYFSALFFYVQGDTQALSDEPDEKRLRELRLKAAQAPVSLIQKESLQQVFLLREELTWELTKRVAVLLVALSGIAGAVFGIWQAI